MGNSSSGIKETIFFNCPTLNIGDRQKSRLKPENVVDVEAEKQAIINKINKINKLKKYKKYNNPYKLKDEFETIPEKILKKFSRADLAKKKCTI